MVMTQEVRSRLNAKLVPHVGQEDGTITPTGMMKIGNDLVIRPRQDSAALRTGQLAHLTDGERRMFKMDIQPVPQQQPVQKAKTRRGKKTAEDQPQEQSSVVVTVRLVDIGVSLPTQYAHCIKGEEVAVLGLNSLSYQPSQVTMDATGMHGILQLDLLGTDHYVFMGQRFTDTNGVPNIILVKLPSTSDEETEDDGQEEQ